MRVILPLIALILTSALYFLLTGEHGAAGPGGLGAWNPTVLTATECGIWLSAAWLVTSALRLAILHYSQRRARISGRVLGTGVPRLLIDVGALVIFLCAILGIVAYVFGQSLGGLLATSGVLAAIIGFAMQRTISDIFSGVALNGERSFSIGDWIVTSAGVTGRVVDATWRAIYLETIEGRTVIVPNSLLIGNPFTNLNAPLRHFRHQELLTLEYSVPVDRAVSILMAAIEMTEGALRDQRSIVYVKDCGDNGVVYSINFWVRDYPESFTVSRDVIANALKLLDQAGLSPAYPKRDIAVFEGPQRHIEYDLNLPAVLHRVPMLKILDEPTLADLGSKGRLQDFPVNTVVVREGEPGESLFVVLSGLLAASRQGKAARARTIGRLVAGEAFGEMSLLTGAPRSATVTAVTPVTLLEIHKDTLEPILKGNPALIARLSELQAARLATQIDGEDLTRDERDELQAMGFATVMRHRILRFFGQATS